MQISVDELMGRLERDDVAVVDIREASDYDDWHIPGSVNVPVYNALARGELEGVRYRLSRVAGDREIVAVCHVGVTSQRAANILSGLGRSAWSLAGGMRAWSVAWSEVPSDALQEPGALLLQIRRHGKGCLSYVVGSEGKALVVDPSLDADVYLAVARRYGLTIDSVLETHVHADHVSRARDLARRCGARLMLPLNQRVTFAFEAIEDGREITVGRIRVRALATPGHTGESTCYRVADRVLFSGDTVFEDSIGRPDLEKGDAGARAGAGALYRSLHDVLLKLPDDTLILPGHTGRPVGYDRRLIARTLGEIRTGINLLDDTPDIFIDRVVAGLSQKPPNFDAVIAVNEGKSSLGPAHAVDLEAGPNRCAVG